MKYLSIKQVAEIWDISPRRVQVLCNQGRLAGAQRVGNVWTIPENLGKPEDARKKTIYEQPSKNTNLIIERSWAMPNKNTFDIKPIAQLIEEELTDGTWIDPFANKNKLATITNDLNAGFNTDYHVDALDFFKMFDDYSIDGVLYDPPYSPRQVSECYNDVGYNVTWDTTKASFWGNHKREISRIVKVGGKVVTFGWNSGGIGNKYGFEIKRILMVPHGGWHNDTICTVEIKTRNVGLQLFGEQKEMKKMNETVNLNDIGLIDRLESLSEGYWDFKNDDTQEYTHGLHNYPAVMVCPISRNIIKIMKETRPINSLFDPFAGSGTVLVEGKIAGINFVVGNDINPLALLLERVKTTNIEISNLQEKAKNLFKRIDSFYQTNLRAIENVNDFLSNSEGLDLTAKKPWGEEAPKYLQKYCKNNNISLIIPDFKNIGYWFKPKVIIMLQEIKNSINELIDDEDMRKFFFVCLSETIRLVSNRRNGEFKMFRMPARKVAIFNPNVADEFAKITKRNMEKMNSFNEVCNESGSQSLIKIFSDNATDLIDINDETFDLVITSPPYGDSRTTVAYGEYSRLSLQWLGLFNLTEKEIMGIDKSLMGGKKYRNGFEYLLPSETLKNSLSIIKDIDLERAGDVYSFYNELYSSIKEIVKKTKIGGYQFWVIGNRTVKGELLMTDKIISEFGKAQNLEEIYKINRNISKKIMPSLNSPTNEPGLKVSTMTNEHIVVFRRRK